jgi:putative two-component system response regulator
LLCAQLHGEGRRVLLAPTAEQALEILHRSPIDLVILDMALPGISGLDFCRRLRADRRTDLTQVLMLSGVEAIGHETACIGSGADAYLARPYQPEALFVRVRSLLRRNAAVSRLEESETILLALAHAVEQRDIITAGHCDRLAALCVAMGMAMNLPARNLLALHRGGYLHDIGQIGMPDSILFKKGPLDEEEWRIMRTHTIKGDVICRPMKCLAPVLPIIRSHHERWNGSGYPDGLAGRNIPMLARVLQFADIYDAMTSARSYKSAMMSSDALGVMQEETGRGWHDPELMRLFLGLRHEHLRDAAERYAEEWQDVQVMKDSLENLRSSVLA